MSGTEAGLPVYRSDADFERAQRELVALDLDDGLPLVTPTRARLEAMLSGVADPRRSYGNVMPLFGELRADAVAYQCVLAGCEPAELPLVLSAVEACQAPEFNLLGVLTTTGTPAIAVIVHPPLSTELGVRSGTNCLGPGSRVNASIGRAVSLVLRNIGGARDGVADMATMGQPGKYTFCFAEDGSTDIPGLAVRRGLRPDEPAVTVMAVSGTAELLPVGGGAGIAEILDPVALAMGATVSVSGAREREPHPQMMLMPPELVQVLAKHGCGLPEMQRYLFDRARVPQCDGAGWDAQRRIAPAADAIDIVITGGPGVKMTYVPLWAGGSATQTVRVRALDGR
ncbi:MAG: hypothetical protein AAF458_16255 [Pseudomonadota bacterium]